MNEDIETDNLETISKRFFEFSEAKGISSTHLADTLDIGASRLSHIKAGRNNISLEICSKILEHYQELSADWLLLGKGNMLRGEKKTQFSQHTSPQDLFSNTVNEKPTPLQEQQASVENAIHSTNLATTTRKVTKIIVFYDDGSFQELTT